MNVITLGLSDFDLVEGIYYSQPFSITDTDMFISINPTLSEDGEVFVESSIDSINWYDIFDSVITCTPSGMESYTECQSGLFYRIKSNKQINSCKILI